MRTLISHALAKLPDAQREVVSMRDVEGWTSEEICDALGISAVNQRVLLHRGRAALRAALEEYLDD
ncbi:alternative RNA polymerase sigma factor [Mycobacteroides abscessus subsp. abscessus]|nr:alternative RNA polymerase sigma factor [Mycobacteroides abscessus subsp. abscessus]SIB19145.1 alternative RNA polymerase sigma factor [Mycobacteroides abscessus subsp. abscessus]SIB95075.1 alternative RNA polymerase sigma factor [Mycobacteroides abscessus subsp. abscessus]SIC49012.1 alternative RNA polymerase sigma factor [Mycobacteroides abscessus subsp. abscessus]SIC55432.1 alternative RNA polymerase sigma factor [Mycobacteroides abscessus subsp. abscessus]